MRFATEKYAAIKATLKARIDELVERAFAIEASLGTPGSSDWEDNAIESEDDDVLLAIRDVTTGDIAEIRLAISRIDSGHYRQCVTCGKAISKERLDALPYATRCVDCS